MGLYDKEDLVRELTLHAKDFKGSGIEELLGETNLLSIVSKFHPFVPQIFLEFYVNLSKDTGHLVQIFRRQLCGDIGSSSLLA